MQALSLKPASASRRRQLVDVLTRLHARVTAPPAIVATRGQGEQSASRPRGQHADGPDEVTRSGAAAEALRLAAAAWMPGGSTWMRRR